MRRTADERMTSRASRKRVSVEAMTSSAARPAARRLRGALALVACLVTAAAVLTPAAQAEDYPSWDDVLAARGDEQATAAQVARIEESLTRAQETSAAASTAALESAAEAALARGAADAAAERADALGAQARDARADLAQAQDELGLLAVGMYRTESAAPLTVRLLTTADPDDLLERLGALERVQGTWAAIARGSRTAAEVASSLTAQADEAEDARAALATEAEQKAAEAQRAADAEAAAVADLTGRVDTLYEQLAALKDTTADMERRYWIGQEVDDDPPPSAPEPGGGGGGGSPAPAPVIPAPDPPPGAITDPAAAQAYARGAVGAYGWDSSQFQCLVWLWNRESGWRVTAENPWSGAYGIPQALPGSKMATAGPDWRTNGRTQVNWGLGYIANRYGTPCNAWQHSEDTGWY